MQKNPTGHKTPAAEAPIDDEAGQYLPGAVAQLLQTKTPELASQPLRTVPAAQPGPHPKQDVDPVAMEYVPGLQSKQPVACSMTE